MLSNKSSTKARIQSLVDGDNKKWKLPLTIPMVAAEEVGM
jgi:hypothetical protein